MRMKLNKRMASPEELSFQNLSEKRLSLRDVMDRILRFMSNDPRSSYQFIIGTDSQVFRGYTKFITGVVIRRIGKGAWACYRQIVVPREILSLKEKLTYETALSQEVAYHITDAGGLNRMEEFLIPYLYQGASLELFIDIDAGTEPVVNKTSLYVQEMVDRVHGMGRYEARVKPDSIGASSYANRFTKKPVELERHIARS